jgi:DNA-binding transcriptional ArsR family regulator
MCARDNAATARNGQRPPTGAQIEATVTMLRLLADPTRLRLLWLLGTGEHDVSSLATTLEVARPSVSQHLAKLKLAGLVTVRREGRRALYTAGDRHVRRLVTEVLRTGAALGHDD